MPVRKRTHASSSDRHLLLPGRLRSSVMHVLVVDHPLAKARLTTMRDARSDSVEFRAALHELTVMLIYEATRDVPVVTERIHTPVARTVGHRLANPPLLVP